MLFTEYLDSVENTEQETRLLEEIAKIEGDLAQAARIPVVGKGITALLALGELGIEEFKQSGHYDNIKGLDIAIDLDKGVFAIYPGAVMRRKIFTVAGIVAAVLFGLWLWRRSRR
ncbi:MAG: hypothetical protein FWE33_06030 [Defluviitaleaceae bacterium]|nr:hypothetical protein [Defluviitaleaceae bacterium]